MGMLLAPALLRKRGNAFMTATGGTVTEDGDYKVHIFTADGTFTVETLGTDPTEGDAVEYLVIAGGGCGAGGPAGSYAGGGAGGMLSGTGLTLTEQGYAVVVGAGGPTSGAGITRGSNGGNSSFGGIITASGGGAAGPLTIGDDNGHGSGGGSGGGGAPSTGNGGAGIAGQGYAGGNSSSSVSGGGGGAGGPGVVGAGGPGLSNSITGAPIEYARGGRNIAPVANRGDGGKTNTAGGSGVVIIRYRFQ